jgi:hypothetical protein
MKRNPVNNLEKELNKIFIDIDPEGLIRMGAYSDEYNSEVRTLIKQRNKCTNVRQTATVIAKIFNESFGSQYHKPKAYMKAAKNILKTLAEQK